MALLDFFTVNNLSLQFTTSGVQCRSKYFCPCIVLTKRFLPYFPLSTIFFSRPIHSFCLFFLFHYFLFVLSKFLYLSFLLSSFFTPSLSLFLPSSLPLFLLSFLFTFLSILITVILPVLSFCSFVILHFSILGLERHSVTAHRMMMSFLLKKEKR